jgi:hypothetical protein
MLGERARSRFASALPGLILALLAAQHAASFPVAAAYTDDARCDTLPGQTLTHELGLAFSFPLDERIGYGGAMQPGAAPACGVSGGLNVHVAFQNLSGVAYRDVFVVAGPTSVFGSLLANADGTVLTDLGPADAFRIDAIGINRPLLAESNGTADGIFEPGETWLVEIIGGFYAVEVLVGDFVFATSLGIGSADVFVGSEGATIPGVSILASPVPETSSAVLLAAALVGVAYGWRSDSRRRRNAALDPDRIGTCARKRMLRDLSPPGFALARPLLEATGHAGALVRAFPDPSVVPGAPTAEAVEPNSADKSRG